MTLKLCNNGLSVIGTREDGATVSYSIEAEEYKQWLSEGNTPEPEFTKAELKLQKDSEAKKEAQAYLASTDYINNKFNEEVLLNKELTQAQFAKKFKTILDKRAEARKLL